jgi:hypothetical protein
MQQIGGIMPRKTYALLNFSTSIAVEKTVGEIETALAKSGANAIMKEYDGVGNIVAVSFRIATPDGMLPFKLPMNVQAIQQVLKNQHKERLIAERFTDLEQARRVGWRIIKDWVEAQCAIIQTQMVTIEQVFLPYATGRDGKTIYQTFIEKRSEFMLESKLEE